MAKLAKLPNLHYLTCAVLITKLASSDPVFNHPKGTYITWKNRSLITLDVYIYGKFQRWYGYSPIKALSGNRWKLPEVRFHTYRDTLIVMQNCNKEGIVEICDIVENFPSLVVLSEGGASTISYHFSHLALPENIHINLRWGDDVEGDFGS